MLTTGFLRFLASGVLLLAVMTTTFVKRAGAYSSELTPTPVTGYTTDGTGITAVPFTSDATGATEAPAAIGNDIICSDQRDVCNADTTCSSCLTASSSTTAREECYEFYYITTSSEGCQFRLDVACCLNNLSEFECLDVEEFVSYHICVLNGYGCAVDEITCDGDESTSEFAGATANLGGAFTGVAFSCEFMVSLLLL